MIMQNRFFALAVFAITFSVALTAGVAFAQSFPPSNYGGYGGMGQGSRGQFPPGVFGQVTTINGTTITITNNRNHTSYMVDASNATIMKNGTSSSIASVAVGDMIMVRGTVSGDSVVATSISDGFGGRGNFPGGRRMASSTFPYNASGTNGRFGYGNRPSGTPPFASGTFPGSHNFSSSTPSSTSSGNSNSQSHYSFFSPIVNIFRNILSFFKW